ncbi:MAG: heme-binding protein [candidate division NC10 bacterium]|nr:heme-binding protein [candidate division NC10 bacterium]
MGLLSRSAKAARLSAVGLLIAIHCLVAFGSVQGASGISLSLNQSTFSVRDTLVLTLINQNAAVGSGDLYLAVQLPDGTIYVWDGANWLLMFDRANLLTSALKPFRLGTTITTSSEPILTIQLPAYIPSGLYTLLALLVKSGMYPLDDGNWLSNLAQTSFTLPATSPFLTAADAAAIVQGAAEALDATTMVIAVTDREGNVLGLFRKHDAPSTFPANFGVPMDANDVAVSLARTGAFFSNNQAPLSSRTVRFISGIHFPPGIANKPNAALYGIENTNRGCALNATFNPGTAINPATSRNGMPCNSLDQSGCGPGIMTGEADLFDSDPNAVNGGGVPIFKDGTLVGGIGVAGVGPERAEFAAFVGSVPNPRFGPRPADPGVIFLEGIALPFVNQTTQPAGSGPGIFDQGGFVVGPLDSPRPAGVPDGWLVGPLGSVELSASEVEQIVNQAVALADQARAAIRLPLGSTTRMVIAVTDLQGKVLGLFRMPDATIFSIDVSVAKARNVVYFSSSARTPDDLPGVPLGTAVTNRTISFGAQPLYPPGIDGTSPGPFFPLFANDVARPCRQGGQTPNLNQSGVVFFPGSMPLYKNGKLVGGLGVSGDGVEQDDLVSAAGATGFAPPLEIRADRVFIRDVRLPLLKFPRNPLAR